MGTMKYFLIALCSTVACLCNALECPIQENATLLPTLDPLQFSYNLEVSIKGTNRL